KSHLPSFVEPFFADILSICLLECPRSTSPPPPARGTQLAQLQSLLQHFPTLPLRISYIPSPWPHIPHPKRCYLHRSDRRRGTERRDKQDAILRHRCLPVCSYRELQREL